MLVGRQIFVGIGGGTVNGLGTSSIVVDEISPLNHKSLDHPVKGTSLVANRLSIFQMLASAKGLEIGRRFGALWKKL